MNHRFLLLLAFFIFSAKAFSQMPGDMPPNPEPGKCYSQCWINDMYEAQEENFAVYIGNNTPESDPNLLLVEVEVFQRNEWVSMGEIYGTEAYCKPDDAAEKVVHEFVIVQDTSLTTDYVIESVTVPSLLTKGHAAWREILCGDNLSAYSIRELQETLIREGSDQLSVTGEMDRETRKMLTNYQKRNCLCAGKLTIETIQRLGVRF